MQSAAKRSDGSNIYKLSDHANGDQDASFDHTDDITKKPAAAGLSYKEPLASGSSKSPEAPDAGKSAAGEPAAAAPSSPDDALAWLRIIQNATEDLTADIRASKGDASARSFADEEAPFGRNPPPSPPGTSPDPRAGSRALTTHGSTITATSVNSLRGFHTGPPKRGRCLRKR